MLLETRRMRRLSNYEHIFESAIDCIKSGEDFDDFKVNAAVQDNIDGEFCFIDSNTDRMDAKLVLLDSIWCIANYVYSEYMRGCPFFKDGCSNAYTNICADCKLGERYD